MATRVLLGMKFFEHFFKLTTNGKFLWSLDEIGLAVYEKMSFKVNVYGRTPDEKGSQKLTMSLCDRWANKLIREWAATIKDIGNLSIKNYPKKLICSIAFSLLYDVFSKLWQPRHKINPPIQLILKNKKNNLWHYLFTHWWEIYWVYKLYKPIKWSV
jgi:hypothetical protein